MNEPRLKALGTVGVEMQPVVHPLHPRLCHRPLTITLPGQTVRMSIGLAMPPSNAWVVWVDVERLLPVWRGEPWARGVLKADRSTWPSDYKFAGAAERWSRSMETPYGLPRVCLIGQGVQFNDGITRTLWLAYHGARVVPLLAYLGEDDARALHALVGAEIPPAPVGRYRED